MKFRGGNFKQLKFCRTRNVMDSSPLTHKVAFGDVRTGTFHQPWVTIGDTACSVKGVLYTSSKQIWPPWTVPCLPSSSDLLHSENMGTKTFVIECFQNT